MLDPQKRQQVVVAEVGGSNPLVVQVQPQHQGPVNHAQLLLVLLGMAINDPVVCFCRAMTKIVSIKEPFKE